MTDKMRRKDREITDKKIIEDFLNTQRIIRIGFYDKANDEVYIVPVNYGYIIENDNYIFYFHGGKMGRKFELTKEGPKVGFEIDGHFELIEGKKACDYSAKYQSIIGNGKLEIVETEEDKKKGLDAVMRQTTGKKEFEYNPKMLQSVCVYKLSVSKMTCKGNLSYY